MRWCTLVIFIAVIAITIAEPEPKKYNQEVKTKGIDANLTQEEKKFLREVEAKFGIKTDIPLEINDGENSSIETIASEDQIKTPYQAVIAIEIVNDTDDKNTLTKGKRTIDANLGYGYQTNNGYTYTYFGKQFQEKPKFMIYPYSQEDIPPANTNAHSSGYSYSSQQASNFQHLLPSVEITPSKAYEVVPTQEEQTAYRYEKPAVEFKANYEKVQSIEHPPPQYPTSKTTRPQATPQTFYTTYNGQQFSGLSGRFPSVMSKYLIDSSQLLKSPQYQSAGLTQAHFQKHAQQEQKVVPVLVLRVPSSYLKKPTAELYANAPHSVSQYLNVNLQELVDKYFRKLGYPNAPQVMAYQSPASYPAKTPEPASVTSYEPHEYASPYVQPTYTHAAHSGIQYSAVQPVMARYPSGYTRQQYYATQERHSQQPQQKQQYVYQYKYVPLSSPEAQRYYSQLKYQQMYRQPQLSQYSAPQTYSQQQQSADQETSHEAGHGVGYDAASYNAQQQGTSEEEESTSVEYEAQQANNGAHSAQRHEQQTAGYEAPTAAPQYETQSESSAEYGSTKVPITTHDNSQSVQVQYEQEQPQPVEVYNRGQAGHSLPESHISQIYQNQANGYDDSLPLSENYPSKDHTIATVLPISYKSRGHSPGAVQSVSYVTPDPSPMKYHSQYRVMVPQTILRRPTEGKVSYVNSHSVPNSYTHMQSSRYNVAQEYSSGSRQRSVKYPWNFHAHVKRESKQDTSKSVDATDKSTPL